MVWSINIKFVFQKLSAIFGGKKKGKTTFHLMAASLEQYRTFEKIVAKSFIVCAAVRTLPSTLILRTQDPVHVDPVHVEHVPGLAENASSCHLVRPSEVVTLAYIMRVSGYP